MTSDAEIAEIRQRLDTWNWAKKSDVMQRAISLGAVGGSLLADELRKRADPSTAVYFIIALGDAEGHDGDDQLIEYLTKTGPGSLDNKGAALLALAKRLGERASPYLHIGLEDRDRSIQSAAMLCLARVGDGSAWDLAFDRWRHWLKKPTKMRDPSSPDEAIGLAYLLKHAADESRKERVREAVRAAWNKLDDIARHAMEEAWPALAQQPIPDDVELPEHGHLDEWINERTWPVFRPMGS
jgi:HEAT repeat protein